MKTLKDLLRPGRGHGESLKAYRARRKLAKQMVDERLGPRGFARVRWNSQAQGTMVYTKLSQTQRRQMESGV